MCEPSVRIPSVFYMSTSWLPALPSLSSLPSLASLSVNTGASLDEENSRKKPRVPRKLLPCPEVLRYDDGEILNMADDMRISAGDAHFSRSALDIVPLVPPFPTSYKELIPIMGSLDLSIMDGVINELYRQDGFDESNAPTSRAQEAFRQTTGNRHRRQYYLKTLTKADTVSHIIRDGEFFSDREEDNNLKVGMDVYSYGFVWCNTNPNWTWKTEDEGKAMRCRIHLPAGTQVIMDRSPVYAGYNTCQFDTQRESLFPDVVLPPGKFEITSVTRYRRKGDVIKRRDNNDTDYINNIKSVVELAPGTHNMNVMVTDAQYAQHMLDTVRKFVDVQLSTRALMVLPTVPH